MLCRLFHPVLGGGPAPLVEFRRASSLRRVCVTGVMVAVLCYVFGFWMWLQNTAHLSGLGDYLRATFVCAVVTVCVCNRLIAFYKNWTLDERQTMYVTAWLAGLTCVQLGLLVYGGFFTSQISRNVKELNSGDYFIVEHDATGRDYAIIICALNGVLAVMLIFDTLNFIFSDTLPQFHLNARSYLNNNAQLHTQQTIQTY